jgi:hypothetical protein
LVFWFYTSYFIYGTNNSILFNSSNSPTPSSNFTPLPTGADSQHPHPVGLAGETEAEPSDTGKTASEVHTFIVAPPAVSAEVADEEMAIRQEVERFRGSQSAEDFIAAVLVLLGVPDLRGSGRHHGGGGPGVQALFAGHGQGGGGHLESF